MDPVSLKIKAVIGFNGLIPSGLHYTPDGEHMLYPLGSFTVLKNIRSGKEAFFDGHTNDVSCITISTDGTIFASGQSHFQGVKADVLVWDLQKGIDLLREGSDVMIGEICVIHRLKQHIGKVQGVCFSPSGAYLATLGGQDDNALVVWDVQSGSSICGSPAGTDSAVCIKWHTQYENRIVTAGNYHVCVWIVDLRNTKLHPMNAKLGSIRRVVLCLDIDDEGNYAYCGTTTGDILKVSIDRNEVVKFSDPDTKIPQLVCVSKNKCAVGCTSIKCCWNPSLDEPNIFIGAGDGSMKLLNTNCNLVKGFENKVLGGITSISINPNGKNYIVGTNQCNQYRVSTDIIKSSLLTSCHFNPIKDIAFPMGCSDLAVTSSLGDIRIWNITNREEILRIQVPNVDCLCSVVTPSGTGIVSGWGDGKVRAFFPESGKLKYVIPDAHNSDVDSRSKQSGVTALAVADTDISGYQQTYRMVSGGAEGRVRVWKITPSHQQMIVSLKEHKGPITCLTVNSDSSQCVSASADGSCIIWDLKNYVRINAFFESQIFTSVVYHPDESQLLTCGTNCKISYWDASDATAIRVIDGGNDHMTCLDILSKGDFFVSGSKDRTLKVCHYDNGINVAEGIGHSGYIQAVKISPDESTIVSVGSCGEIIIWEAPDYEAAAEALDL